MAAPARKPIRLLDSATVDRIAAGEVIERPASVVKELVENALDAGARSLRIVLQEGGLASVVVEDDGHGIPQRDLPLAFERHATSKIGSAADILQVGTFGFRGEALASIASVSRCTLLSRVEEDEVGGMMTVTGGQIERREPAPRNRGTTVTVADLFFNTPARRKFMGTAAAEQRAVVQAVTALALAHPEVRWLLAGSGQTLLDLLPVDSLPARARDLFGSAVLEHLARFEKSEAGLAVGGLASRPTWTRGNRSQQFLYVNRRPIHSPPLLQAIQQAYREVIPPGRHPVAIVFLQVPAGEVDVNVHPAKNEVRLLLERSVFTLLVRALREGLDLRAAAAAGAGGAEGGPPTPLSAGALAGQLTGPLAGLAAAEHDYLQRHFGGPAAAAGQPPAPRGQGDLFGSGRSGGASALESAVADAGALPLRQSPFWQLHRTYILTQIRGALVLIDQHNSHERILYNEARQALRDGGAAIPTQQLLFPVHLELSPAQVQAFQSCRAQLERIGFVVQPFGGQSILVQGIPSSLRNWGEGRLLLDLLDDLAAGGEGGEENRDLLASFACHGAVRAGEPLTVPEMQNLVDRLFATDTPLSCPHGRPTLIQFTLEDLEKRFGRR